MRPSVTINALNLKNGQSNEIERQALFVGVGTKNTDQLIALSNDSDLDKLFGDTELKNVLHAARLNAGANWQAYAYVQAIDQFNFGDAVRKANETGTFEYCVNTHTAGVTKESINDLQALFAELVAKYARRQFFMQAVAGIDNTENGETWAEYVARLTQLQQGIAADHVMLIPTLFGNDVGVLAGRLANRTVTIADSPARVRTGALVGLATVEKPTDKDGNPLSMAHITALEQARYSSVMWYPDYDGYYWSDGRTLDAEGGDLQAIEFVRVLDKAARRVRIKAIGKIADRSFNNTQASIEAHKLLFAQPLREMAKSVQIGTELFPGECYPPTDDSIEIVWRNKSQVEVYIKIQPLECPKQIVVSILLDLNLYQGG